MRHLAYYQYQAAARGIHGIQDVIRSARSRWHVWNHVVRPWLPENPARPIVELACGHGSFLYWLKEGNFSQVTGVDSSEEQVEFARQTGTNVVQMDVNQWLSRQEEGSVEAIVGIDLIEHLSKDDFMELLGNSCRVLSPTGRLILRYPNGDSPLVGMNLFNDVTHIWTYTPNCLNSLAIMHGYRRSRFTDESSAAIRDYRWLKVPLCKLSQRVLAWLFQAATREKIVFWSPHIWACLEK